MTEQAMRIAPIDPRQEKVVAMIDMLDHYQQSLYPAHSNHLEPISELIKPNAFFVGALEGDQLSGIGAFIVRETREARYVEIKRIYVPPRSRNRGIAKRIMAALENKAADLGFGIARLETGIHQNEAIALYKKLGYRQIGPFGSYGQDPLSIFMEKKIA